MNVELYPMEPNILPQAQIALLNNPDAEKAYIDQIRERVEELLQNDPGLLFSHLYRLDISEKKLNHILQTIPSMDVPQAFALEIWHRQKERLKYKMETPVKRLSEDWDY